MASSQGGAETLAASDASQDNCPANTDFRQQRLKAWQPVLTPFYVIATFAAIGILFLPIGVVLLQTSMGVVEYQQRYDELPGSSVIVNITVDKLMTGPVFVYYGLDNFYQNHRRYVKSRDDLQLAGTLTDYSPTAVQSSCTPMVTYRADGTQVTQVLNPCGLIASSMFNDTISLVSASGSASAASVPTHWTESGIAWPSDVAYKYANNEAYKCQEAFNTTAAYGSCSAQMKTNAASQRWINQIYNDESVINSTLGVQDEHFIVWMRTAGGFCVLLGWLGGWGWGVGWGGATRVRCASVHAWTHTGSENCCRL